MKIKLEPELERYVRDRVGRRRYASVDDMIARALVILEATERAFDPVQELRREIDVGIADLKAGRHVPWDAEKMKKRVEQRVKRAS